MKIEWRDGGRESRCESNPNYPDGVVLDGTRKGQRSCRADLPYPAKRCGVYIVECEICGIRFAVTTAGRRDDPKAIILPCKEPIKSAAVN
jgi:hypothetical protein